MSWSMRYNYLFHVNDANQASVINWIEWDSLNHDAMFYPLWNFSLIYFYFQQINYKLTKLNYKLDALYWMQHSIFYWYVFWSNFINFLTFHHNSYFWLDIVIRRRAWLAGVGFSHRRNDPIVGKVTEYNDAFNKQSLSNFKSFQILFAIKSTFNDSK